jgi:hypothetical protein
MIQTFRRMALPLALAASLVPAANANAANLSFVPGTASFELGQSFSIDVVLSGLPADADVSFYDIDLVFDPAVLRFVDVSLGDALGSVAGGQAIDASLPPDLAGGTLNLSVLSLLDSLPAQGESPLLGTLRFDAVGLGAASLGFGFVNVEDMLSAPITVTALDGAVSVVPEPGAAAMLALGLAALALRRRLGR